MAYVFPGVDGAPRVDDARVFGRALDRACSWFMVDGTVAVPCKVRGRGAARHTSLMCSQAQTPKHGGGMRQRQHWPATLVIGLSVFLSALSSSPERAKKGGREQEGRRSSAEPYKAHASG